MNSNPTPRALPALAGRYSLLAAWRQFWPELLVWGLVSGYIVVFTWLAILRHDSFNSSGFDLGIYDQVTWNTLHGRFFFYTTTGQPALHFSNHASLNILLVAPFYLIHSGPETLLFLQAAAIGLGGLPLFWLGREKLKSDLAALSLLLAYLLFPTLEIVTLWDFHPPVLSVGFFMFAFYFLVKRRPVWFLVFVILAISGKESLPLQGAFLGLYAMLRYRAWRLGGITMALCLAWFFAVMYWLIPAYSVTGEHLFIGYYADLGDTPAQIVLTALTRPDLILKNVWQPDKLRYLYDLLTPFAYLPLAGLPVLLIGTPSFAINLLSANTAMHDATGGQYGADVAPWLAWGALYGLVYLRRAINYWRPAMATAATTLLSLILVSVAVVWHLFRGYSPLAFDPPHWEITRHDRLAERFLAQIPAEASVAAQGKLYPHLSNRVIAYQLPDVNQAEYVFFDVTTGTWPVHPNDIHTLAQDLLRSGEYGVLDAADGYLLLKRGLPDPTVPDAFYDFARVETADPQYALNIQFGDDLRLLGFDLLPDPRRQETAVRLYWQALRPLDRALRLYPFFLDDQGHIVETTEQRPLLTQLWYPLQQWQPGQIVVAETMPWRLGDRWSLAVGVLDGSDWSDWSRRLQVRLLDSPGQARPFEAKTWVRLATFEQQGRKLVELLPNSQVPPPAYPLAANFGDQLELKGYDLSPAVGHPGQALTLTLSWQALREIPVDYTIFVHLVDANGQLVAQQDDNPWWEIPFPTSTWQPGELLQDRHELELPPDLPPGSYTLRVGVYYWQTLERLPLLENKVAVNNYVELGSIAVK
jgi:uncharacterized membrane protein